LFGCILAASSREKQEQGKNQDTCQFHAINDNANGRLQHRRSTTVKPTEY
jgi:hypothetical protein